MSTARLSLTRRFPSGRSAPVIPDLTPAKVRMYVGMCLVDNGACSRSEAGPTANAVTASVGTWVEHPSGYAFLAERS